ncbi:MAG: class I SAM-dependent RNA methyltransferase [Candidatus Riflebacteria bacterium]|nr:class I SAM-dependent RNA methyltransferase [Candidatus Riflebacteria bacterium]
METVIERMSYGLDSLARLDGKAIFVPYGVPGDEVTIEITEEKKDYSKAEIKEIKKPSDFRRESPCPAFPDCGGCHWLQMTDEAQRTQKEEVLAFALKALAPKKIYPMEPLPSRGYRNKLDLKIAVDEAGNVTLGNYKFRSHDVVPIDGCIVQAEANMKIYGILKDSLQKQEHLEYAKNISNVSARTLGGYQVCTVFLKEPPKEAETAYYKELFEALSEVTRFEVKAGNKTILTLMRETPPFLFLGKKWRISANSFFQNNLTGAEAIMENLLSIYKSFEHKGKFLDLYSGCGTQTFLLEHFFDDEVYAIEGNQSSHQDALFHQKGLSASKAKFLCRSVESIFNTKITKGVIAAMHLNPPRTGLSQQVLNGLAGIKPKIITYLSCNPMTFRRDAKHIKQMGYIYEACFPFDLFPGTFHMETLNLFVRR